MMIVMNLTAKEYKKLSEKTAPKSPVLIDCLKAFVIGGLICALGEVIIQNALKLNLDIVTARGIGSIMLIALSALLTSLNVYDAIARHAGAGTLVPITGFANAIVSPAIEFKTEGYILGVAAKMFNIAGPVLVYGLTSSVIYGFILMIMSSFN